MAIFVQMILAETLSNLINPEALTITGLLIAYIVICRAEIKAAKEETTNLTLYYRGVVDKLVARIDLLQKEKYEVTREILPLLIELIQKLNKEEK